MKIIYTSTYKLLHVVVALIVLSFITLVSTRACLIVKKLIAVITSRDANIYNESDLIKFWDVDLSAICVCALRLKTSSTHSQMSPTKALSLCYATNNTYVLKDVMLEFGCRKILGYVFQNYVRLFVA